MKTIEIKGLNKGIQAWRWCDDNVELRWFERRAYEVKCFRQSELNPTDNWRRSRYLEEMTNPNQIRIPTFDTMYNLAEYHFTFKRDSDALLFKMAWSGV